MNLRTVASDMDVKRIFIGNLPYQANEGELEAWFVGFGVNVDSVSIIRDRFSGQARGFGFVEVNDDAAADRAIAACNGKDFMGRTLVVNEARPMGERPPQREAWPENREGSERPQRGSRGRRH